MALLTSPAHTQDTLVHRVGVGISIEPAMFGSSLVYVSYPSSSYLYAVVAQPAYATTPINVYVPILARDNVRIEPQFGIYSFGYEETDRTPATQFNPASVSTYKYDASLIHLALGVSYIVPVSEKVQVSFGPKVGLNLVSSTSVLPTYSGYPVLISQQIDTKETDFYLGAGFGGEYIASRDFTLGAEVAVDYVSFGNPERTYSPPSTAPSTTVERKQHVVQSGALFFVRWYFL